MAEFDDPVHGLRAAVARAIGIEVGQERGLPAAERRPLIGDFWDRAGPQLLDQLLGQSSASGRSGLV